MTNPVYSVALFDHPNTTIAGSYTSSSVPSGYRWVVRDINFVNEAMGPTFFSGIHVAKQSSAAPIFGVRHQQCRPGATYHWEGHCVLNTADALVVQVFDVNGWGWTISGYQLTLP